MNKYSKRVDANHQDVIKTLRSIEGIIVEDTSDVGGGFPDLLIGYRKNGERRFALMEIKDGNKVKSAQKLTPAQVKWHEKWDGFPVCLVDGPDAARRHVAVLQS